MKQKIVTSILTESGNNEIWSSGVLSFYVAITSDT